MIIKATGRPPWRFHQLCNFLIERDERFCAQPILFVSNDAVGEVASRLHVYQSSFHRLPVHHHVGAVNQPPAAIFIVCRPTFVS